MKTKAFTAVTYAKRTTMNIASIINRPVLRVARRYSFSCWAENSKVVFIFLLKMVIYIFASSLDGIFQRIGKSI